MDPPLPVDRLLPVDPRLPVTPPLPRVPLLPEDPPLAAEPEDPRLPPLLDRLEEIVLVKTTCPLLPVDPAVAREPLEEVEIELADPDDREPLDVELVVAVPRVPVLAALPVDGDPDALPEEP
jgi:hypothetical protein